MKILAKILPSLFIAGVFFVLSFSVSYAALNETCKDSDFQYTIKENYEELISIPNKTGTIDTSFAKLNIEYSTLSGAKITLDDESKKLSQIGNYLIKVFTSDKKYDAVRNNNTLCGDYCTFDNWPSLKFKNGNTELDVNLSNPELSLLSVKKVRDTQYVVSFSLSGDFQAKPICVLKSCADFNAPKAINCPTDKGCQIDVATNLCIDGASVSSGNDFLGGLKATQSEISLFNKQQGVNKGATIDSIARIINRILTFLGVIFMLLVMYAGYLWLSAAGNTDKVTKAKSILVNATIGIILVSMAYGITSFVVDRLYSATQTGDSTSTEPLRDN